MLDKLNGLELEKIIKTYSRLNTKDIDSNYSLITKEGITIQVRTLDLILDILEEIKTYEKMIIDKEKHKLHIYGDSIISFTYVIDLL